MLWGLLRDSTLGTILRLVIFRREETLDPSLYQRYMIKGTPAYSDTGGVRVAEQARDDAAIDTSTDAEVEQEVGQQQDRSDRSRVSSTTRVGSVEGHGKETSNADPEKGRDSTIVTWYSNTDPEVRQIILFR
jgi:DHA1 family multidrug resistance protein-like MFS transporter